MGSPAELDLYLEDLVNSGGPPGISVVVTKDGETVYNNAFGLADAPGAIPATPSTVYHWFSVTKIAVTSDPADLSHIADALSLHVAIERI